MAKNYTFAEAVAIINEGKDLDAITDIGRRYPILLHKVGNVCALAGQAFVDLASFMPDYLTANKVNSAMKSAVGETENTESDDEIKEPKKMAEATEEDEATEGTNYENMSGKEMWDLLGKAGKRKLAKSTKKADLIEACKLAFGEGATTEAEEEAEEETTESGNAYDGKSAMELFKECKKRGIKAAPKKPAKFYADLLIKNDAEATEAEAESEDEWDEEPKEEAKEPKAKKTAPKTEKKAAKKAEPKEESEDDDWDI